MIPRDKTAFFISVLPIAYTLLAGACGEDCDPGETCCEGHVIMICVAGDNEDDVYSEEEEDACGFLCDLIDIWDEATDNYWDEQRSCDDDGKTCIEKTDSSGESYAACGYSQEY